MNWIEAGRSRFQIWLLRFAEAVLQHFAVANEAEPKEGPGSESAGESGEESEEELEGLMSGTMRATPVSIGTQMCTRNVRIFCVEFFLLCMRNSSMPASR